jgi:poly(A) polymerase
LPAIDPELLAELRPVATRFTAAGHRVFLVGGLVRDQLMGRPLRAHHDFDLTTDATPPAIKKVVSPVASAVWTQGERFGTIGCHIDGREFEITTHRGESYEPSSRKPNVAFTDVVEQDLARRDFTVNAMAVSLPDGELVDPFGGRADLDARVLRTPLVPTVSFSEDPLRMLRAARFVAGHDLRPDAELLAAIDELAPRMAIVSVERRRDELDKLLSVRDPRPGLRLVLDHGLAPFVLPALAEADAAHRERAFAAVVELPADRALRLAALVAPEDRPPRAQVKRRLRDLRYSNDVIASVDAIVAGLLAIVGADADWSPERVRRIAAASGAHLDDSIAVASTRIDTAQLRDAVRTLRAFEDLDALDPALDGDDVMAALGLSPGADVGRAMAFLRELRIVEGPLDPADARDRLAAWWRRSAG